MEVSGTPIKIHKISVQRVMRSSLARGLTLIRSNQITLNQLTFTCSKAAIETLGKGMKYNQN